jgi:hypothetical protein
LRSVHQEAVGSQRWWQFSSWSPPSLVHSHKRYPSLISLAMYVNNTTLFIQINRWSGPLTALKDLAQATWSPWRLFPLQQLKNCLPIHIWTFRIHHKAKSSKRATLCANVVWNPTASGLRWANVAGGCFSQC